MVRVQSEWQSSVAPLKGLLKGWEEGGARKDLTKGLWASSGWLSKKSPTRKCCSNRKVAPPIYRLWTKPPPCSTLLATKEGPMWYLWADMNNSLLAGNQSPKGWTGRKKGRDGCKIDSYLPQHIVFTWHRQLLSACWVPSSELCNWEVRVCRGLKDEEEDWAHVPLAQTTNGIYMLLFTFLSLAVTFHKHKIKGTIRRTVCGFLK